MGGALFKEPWRTLPESEETLRFLKSYKPEKEQSTHVRILIYGPTGCGKSSFINSVDSVFKDRIAGRALVAETSLYSFTRKYKMYKIYTDAGRSFSFVFNDILGLEESEGVLVEDVKLALKGHIKDGYEFRPDCPLKENDPFYNAHPNLDDRVHVLVTVVPVGSVSLLSDKVVNKMKEVRLAASNMGIPQLAILTKPDEYCSTVERKIENLYKSKRLKHQVKEFSMILGIPVSYIHLVKNYTSEKGTNDTINLHILSALKMMVMFGKDFLNDLADQPQ